MARKAQETDPRKCRVLYGGKPRWHPVFENNPRIAGLHEEGDFQILHARDPVTNMRPYHVSKSAERWGYNLSHRAIPGELYFTEGERGFAESFNPGIILAPDVKPGASINKQWSQVYWRDFARRARAAGLRLSQFAFPGYFHIGEGVETMSTPGYRLAAAIMARADGFVGHEGGMHHTAAALGIRGVVIVGGFSPCEVIEYPDLHRTLGARGSDACGMRVRCPHCADWMSRITPSLVLQHLQEILQCPKQN